MLSPSVRDDRALAAVVLALKAADKQLKADINKATRDTMNPVWRTLTAANARRPLDQAVLLKGVRIAAGNPPAAVAATSKRLLGGHGQVPAEWWAAVEFGVTADHRQTYSRRGRRGSHQVTRNVTANLPPRYRTGRVLYPAFAELSPRMGSLWAQIVVKKYAEAIEAGGRE
ncbi:hypothetical protein [Xylanimonas ulmi]|uniref:HK97 gp10 family phage protein n=1 Tax=Xylanimonas ulmi TaxID=228973 RepID=A0A4V2EXS0_9MICO|nr:hypothetical protein [Xylanibacterium ulmi]RZS60460.1 hypothetical protein EV386_0718 [Xylanibacterium ulmi]